MPTEQEIAQLSISDPPAPELAQNDTPADRKKTISSAELWGRLTREAPTLTGATILDSTCSIISVHYSQRDVISSRLRTYTTTLTRIGGGRYSPDMPVESLQTSFYSPSRNRSVRFKTLDESLFVEVWSKQIGLEAVWAIDDSLHGSVCTDEWFGGLAWSPDESMFIYIAEKPVPKLEDSTTKASSSTGLQNWAKKLEHKFTENVRDPFGEGLDSRRAPTLFLGDIASEASYSYANGKCSFLLGDPQWSPDGKVIALTARSTPFRDVDKDVGSIHRSPYELGLRYCYNRMQEIILIRAPATPAEFQTAQFAAVRLSNPHDLDDFCCYSPRFCPQSKTVLFLSFPRETEYRGEGKVLPHNAAKVLRAADISDVFGLLNRNHGPKPYNFALFQPRTILPIPTNPGVDDFPGLFLHELPQRPWIDKNTIVFTSVWHHRRRIVRASFRRDEAGLFAFASPVDKIDCSDLMATYTEQLVQLGCETNNKDNSMTLLDKRDLCILFSCSNVATPAKLCVMDMRKGIVTQVTSDRQAPVIETWDQHTEFLHAHMNVPEPFGKSAESIPRNAVDLSRQFHVTLTCPVPPGTLTNGYGDKNTSEEEKLPLVVYPHGGPHSVSLNAFSTGAAALLKLGFAILHVNYRGSIGYGEPSLRTLPGKVGSQDIVEVVQGTRWALNHWHAVLNSAKVAFLGGSHSGFQGAHVSLIPCLFRRTVLRNPVVNIASMAGSSDIPDWCFCETQLDQRNENGIPLCPDGSQLTVMYAHSPISKVKPEKYKLTRPGKTLLQVGGSDRRVPPSQSLEWKRAMTEAYGSDAVTMRWYPDSGHALDGVPDGDDAWVHALDFLREMQDSPKRFG